MATTGFFTHAPKWTYSSKYPLHNRASKVIGLITINRPYTGVMGHDAELNRLLPAIEHVDRHHAPHRIRHQGRFGLGLN